MTESKTWDLSESEFHIGATMRIINKSGHPLEYATAGSVGLDLRAVMATRREIPAGGRWIFDTGIAIELPPGHVAMVQPRSGLALNHGVVASTGIIDTDYRGTIRVCLFNLWRVEYMVNPGDRIAQLVIMPTVRVVPIEVEELTHTQRGESGFGSSGR